MIRGCSGFGPLELEGKGEKLGGLWTPRVEGMLRKKDTVEAMTLSRVRPLLWSVHEVHQASDRAQGQHHDHVHKGVQADPHAKQSQLVCVGGKDGRVT